MQTKPAIDRRQQRAVLSQSDQEFLNKTRERFRHHSNDKGNLDQGRLRRLLRIPDPYLGKQLFHVLSTASNGKLSEENFLNSVTELVLGTDQKKLKFIFDLHDANNDGKISREELDAMLKASLRHSPLHVKSDDMRSIGSALLKEYGSRSMDFSGFRKLLSKDAMVRTALLQSVSSWFGAKPGQQTDVRHRRLSTVLRYLAVVVPYYAWRVMLILAYVGANVFFFQRAFIAYREAGANIYVQIARGGGACLNFNGMLILIPMMRTFLTWMRKSFLSAFVPVDQNIEIHKWIGRVMFIFALLHTSAHLINYSTLESGILDNLFGTDVGLTGAIAMGVFILMWLFSLSFIRRTRLYEAFSATHALYWIWFPASILHADSFLRWTIVPIAGFLLELIIRRFIKREQSFVTSAETHESGVTHLKLHRPETFGFKAGEYLFLKIPKLSHFGWHPFTISSAPENDDHIGVHIRTLGNWTNRLFANMNSLPKSKRSLPVQLHGPYGSPSARIFNSRCAILIGAGIGVTPFASILESIALRKKNGLPMKLEKVYFFWLYRGQKTFEWFGDLLAEIEEQTNQRLLEIHIYLTDARINPTTGLLKIGMDLVGQKKQSDVLTGLKTKTNFGRPDWDTVFSNISNKHELNRVNVFFCGPYPLGQTIRAAARRVGFHFRMENF